jgi:DNA primase
VRRPPIRPASVRPKEKRTRPATWGPDERACLAAAVELYHGRLLSDPSALDYVTGRGIDQTTIEHCRMGYATGDELAAYLRWRRLPLGAAGRVGLLGHDGREFLAGRVVVPEIRSGQPIWLVGRTIDPAEPEPKYLGLPGRKPLLGWETAGLARAVVLTEGVFDWLTLRCWGFPALALVGTHARPATLRALGRFERIFLVLDGDDAGRTAATSLQRTLGDRAMEVELPGVKDVAELALRPDGRDRFARAIEEAERSGTAVAKTR